MTKSLESVLSRVLSTEIGTQLALREMDMKNDLPYEDRDVVINELKQFMDVRGISLNHHYVIQGKEQAKG